MVHPHKIFGRLGNSLFQYASLYCHAKDLGTDFYFQDPKYFDRYSNEIKELFGEGIGFLPYTAIHLRVGSNPLNVHEPKYMENPHYVSLVKTGYYIDAVNQFPNGKFIVFSDDMAFAKTYFQGDRFAFDDSETDLEAFNKMASCQNQIIANSSFSWWAAYLNKNVNKIIVAPTIDKWYSDGVERTVCPEEWLRL